MKPTRTISHHTDRSLMMCSESGTLNVTLAVLMKLVGGKGKILDLSRQ